MHVPALPNVTAVNALGDFAIAADRLALIDGEVDPWKPATPHSRYAPARNHTRLRPFLEIKDGVHHWDEVGLKVCVGRGVLNLRVEWPGEPRRRAGGDPAGAQRDDRFREGVAEGLEEGRVNTLYCTGA
jgi:hypothetical protein